MRKSHTNPSIDSVDPSLYPIEVSYVPADSVQAVIVFVARFDPSIFKVTVVPITLTHANTHLSI